MWEIFKPSARALPPGVVNGIVAGEDQLGDGYKGIALLSELFQDGGQGLGGVEGRVMKENDGPRAYLAGHPLGDLVGGDFFPVQAVPIPNSFKRLRPKEIRRDFTNRLFPCSFG